MNVQPKQEHFQTFTVLQTRFLILLFAVMVLSIPLTAQAPDRRTDRILSKSESYIQKKQYEKAEKYLRYSINKVSDKDRLWQRLGQLAGSRKKYELAAEYYKMAMNFRPENREPYELIVLKYLVLSEQYLEAEYLLSRMVPKVSWPQQKVETYNHYKTFFSDKNMLYSNVNEEIRVENLGDAVNSAYHEYFPSLSHDDSIMIFTRRFNGVEEDFFIVYRDSCHEQWYSAEHMGYPPNSVRNEGAQCLSYDRKYIYLMRCENDYQSYREAGGCDLYMSFSREGDWVAPMPFGATINTNYFEGMPTFSSDNKTLYFVSDRPGGYGGKDIWKTEYTSHGWSIPVNLGPGINTDKDEISPFIAADNKTLFFSSNGHIGFGGHDVFMSKLDEDKNEFSRPVNLGMPYNSAYDDISWFLLADGEKAYLASDRPGGLGGMDIYTANVLPKFRPEPTTFLEGVVTDTISGQPLTNAFIDVLDEQDSLIRRVTTNTGDGSFFISLEPHRTYKIIARRYDYPEKQIIYHAGIIAHHPPIEFNIELMNWRDRQNLYQTEKVDEFPESSEDDSSLYDELIEIKIDQPGAPE